MAKSEYQNIAERAAENCLDELIALIEAVWGLNTEVDIEDTQADDAWHAVIVSTELKRTIIYQYQILKVRVEERQGGYHELQVFTADTMGWEGWYSRCKLTEYEIFHLFDVVDQYADLKIAAENGER